MMLCHNTQNSQFSQSATARVGFHTPVSGSQYGGGRGWEVPGGTESSAADRRKDQPKTNRGVVTLSWGKSQSLKPFKALSGPKPPPQNLSV